MEPDAGPQPEEGDETLRRLPRVVAVQAVPKA
jgi:hypothetical protein